MFMMTVHLGKLVNKEMFSNEPNRNWMISVSDTSIALCAGVPAGSQRHHPQLAAGASALESHHTQVGSLDRTQKYHMTRAPSGLKGYWCDSKKLTEAEVKSNSDTQKGCHRNAHNNMTLPSGPNLPPPPPPPPPPPLPLLLLLPELTHSTYCFMVIISYTLTSSETPPSDCYKVFCYPCISSGTFLSVTCSSTLFTHSYWYCTAQAKIISANICQNLTSSLL